MTTDIHALCKHEIIRRDSELEALRLQLKATNDAYECACGTEQLIKQELLLLRTASDSLRTQNRELREVLLRELNYWENYTPNMVACPARHVDGINKALALLPEK